MGFAPFGVHVFAAPVHGLLLVGLAVAARRWWPGGGWRTAVVLTLGFVPTFMLAHLVAAPLLRVWLWLTARRIARRPIDRTDDRA